MLRIVFVLFILGSYEYEKCFGDSLQTDDWRKKGFYRPRRNYAIQSQTENSFQTSRGHNYQNQNPFYSKFIESSTASYSGNYGSQNAFGINQNVQRQNEYTASYQPLNAFGIRSQDFKASSSGTSFSQNQSQASFGANLMIGHGFSSNSQNSLHSFPQKAESSFATNYNLNPSRQSNSQNSFISNFHQPQSQNSVKTSDPNIIGNIRMQNSYENSPFSNFGQNAFAQQNSTFNNFSSNFGSKSAVPKGQNYKAPDYLPPFMGPEYLPPEKTRTTFPAYVPSQTTTTRRPFVTTTTTKQPLYTTTTRRPYYTITTIKRPLFTTSTTKRPFFTTTTTKRPLFTTTTTKRPTYTTTTQKIVTVKIRKPPMAIPTQDDDGSDRNPIGTGQVSPAMAMNVPPEPDDDEETVDDFRTTTTRKPFLFPPSPAMAMPVPPEEDDPTTTTTTTTSTTLSTTTTTTTPLPTTTKTPPTTTSTTPSTTTTTPSTTTTTTPPTTTSTIPSTTITTTTPSTTTTTTPPTTTTTTPSTTITTTNPSTTTSTTPPTTTSPTPLTTITTTTPSTTTTTTPPKTTSTTPSTFTPTTTTSTTHTPDPNRNIMEEESSPTTQTTPQTTPSDIPFQAPPYLPPRNTTSVPPKPALAMLVPPEPECDPLDPSTYPSDIDQRNFGDNPCVPTTTTTAKPVFRGPLYLPPPPKTRVGRSSNNTMRLGDLKGIPRPVWYAGIYKKTTDPYLPICGGSVVREDVIISAAHCFWDDAVGKQPAELFAVAANKIYKPWRDPMDKKAQKSDVVDIKIPPRFLGAKTSFQEDLAVLRLATPFKYARGLRPICVDFDVEFDREQMKAGHQGTIAGWGYTDANGTPTQRLLWLELPYVEIEKCIRDSEDSFLKYITCDKVCAGENDTGKALCRGDSGGGLAFWQGTPARATPFLRGVASTAPARRGAECNVFAYASFTHVRAHRTFLRDLVPDIEECRFWE